MLLTEPFKPNNLEQLMTGSVVQLSLRQQLQVGCVMQILAGGQRVIGCVALCMYEGPQHMAWLIADPCVCLSLALFQQHYPRTTIACDTAPIVAGGGGRTLDWVMSKPVHVMNSHDLRLGRD